MAMGIPAAEGCWFGRTSAKCMNSPPVGPAAAAFFRAKDGMLISILNPNIVSPEQQTFRHLLGFSRRKNGQRGPYTTT